ncbi:ABC transporter ATP-binding protein [Pontibacter sp. JAM-7]|uniref:ABC transporter ATP-binding protein n=1 Tax=Pontibacter sp. JAM-7 TaxID=3366581 RepID=UPI003AF7BD78
MDHSKTVDYQCVINAQDVAKRFASQAGDIHLFSQINLQIVQGESVAITGPSGAGKSSLLSLLAGLDEPSAGSIELCSKNLSTLSDSEQSAFRASNISFIFQSFHLLPELGALSNVMLPLQILGQPDARQVATTRLDQVGLGHRLHHKPAQLSGGEQQRVAIARAFATNPALLFADEPTGNLDQHTGEQIIDQLLELNRAEATTLILITHDPALAARCQRTFHLDNGQLQERQS